MTIEVSLRPHPGDPPSPVTSIVVALTPHARQLELRYRLAGVLARVRIADAPLDPARLWAHTCCEIFAGPRDGLRYDEWNLAPNRQTAHFAFADVRRREASADVARAEVLEVIREPEALVLTATVAIPEHAGDALRVAIAVVVEADDGSLGYWALAHGRDVPDFHHATSFVLGVDLGSAP